MKNLFHRFAKKSKQLLKIAFTKQPREHSERYEKRVSFLNRYSILFHALLACLLVFIVEVISRRSLFSALGFVGSHTGAFFYNAFLVFVSLTLVYLFRRRAFWRIIVSGFWLILGIINGCILSNRVTPFGYTDLKCIGDLLSMTNTSYFTAKEATLVVIGLGIFFLFCVIFFIKGPRYEGKLHYLRTPVCLTVLLFVAIPVTTEAAQNSNVIASYFSNIAQGYESYGFIYGFSSSVVDRGMSKPEEYSAGSIAQIEATVAAKAEETTDEAHPNVILILLESFVDPDEIKFLDYNTDPIPTFHSLEKNYSTGYLTVPVVGAGTANTEFEVLTGMSIQYFGTGEYPYKTILKKTDCEGVAADLSSIGYGTHAVHNNGGNFYSRVNAFSMMGFDTFTSKELMDIRTVTPNGSWATDDILVPETIKTLDATAGQPDFTYTITVGTHGDYPKEPVIEDPQYHALGVEDEGMTNAWTYYINQLNEVDTFLGDLIRELKERDEDTLVVAFGDHLPTMGLTDADMISGDIYKTNYVTWNNFGLEKQDADLYAYQLMAKMTDDIGIHEGTILTYHQTQYDSPAYPDGLEKLQYDILYGDRYAYDGEDAYPATDIVMGIDEVTLDSYTTDPAADNLYLQGTNFTKWSRVYLNGEKVKTNYLNKYCISIPLDSVKDEDVITVCQVGSSNTIFRRSNELVWYSPEHIEDTEMNRSLSTGGAVYWDQNTKRRAYE